MNRSSDEELEYTCRRICLWKPVYFMWILISTLTKSCKYPSTGFQFSHAQCLALKPHVESDELKINE